MMELELTKSKINQIMALSETIKNYFGKNDKDLEAEMSRLVEMIKEEQQNKEKISNILYQLANKL